MRLPNGCYHTLTDEGEIHFEVILENFQLSFWDSHTEYWRTLPEVDIILDDLRKFEEDGHKPELKIPEEYLL